MVCCAIRCWSAFPPWDPFDKLVPSFVSIVGPRFLHGDSSDKLVSSFDSVIGPRFLYGICPLSLCHPSIALLVRVSSMGSVR